MPDASPQIPPRATRALLLAALLVACTPDQPQTPTPDDPGVRIEQTALRRLTEPQLRTSLHALLGDVEISDLEPDLVRGGFASVGSSEVVTSERGVEQLAMAVDRAVDAAFSSGVVPGGLPCDEQSSWDATCAGQFLGLFGRRAWRRPLTDDERVRYLALGQDVAAAEGSMHGALAAMASALLQSPWFVYRLEAPTEGGFVGFAMASRMAFFLWGGPPDDALLDAAASGGLDTAEAVKAQAERMLQDPRAEQGIVAFVRELYQLHRIDGITRDFVELIGEEELFTVGEQGSSVVVLSDQIKRSMRGEVEHTYAAAMRNDGDLLELLVTDMTVVNDTLAKIYELNPTHTVGPHTWAPARRSRGQRRGILGSMGLLSLYNKQNATSPTLRGKFVSEAFLCREIPPPPPGVATGFEAPDDVSRREALSIHATDPSCAACHAQMDPLGFALDSFDAIGMERREDDYGFNLDLRGELDGETFKGLAELAWVLRNHPDTESCFSRHVFRYATGRVDAASDDASLAHLRGVFASQGFQWRATTAAFVASSAFRGMPGTEAAATTTTDDLPAIERDLFAASCAPCHTDSLYGGLSLAGDGGLRDRLLAPSTQVPAMPLVAPGEPDRSYLLLKIEDSHSAVGGTGTVMPPSGAISADLQSRLRAWIADGAR